MKKTVSNVLWLLVCTAFGLLFCASFASAAPFVNTTPFTTAQVDVCVFTLNTGVAVELPPVNVDATTSKCKFDVAAAQNGNNVVTIQYKNIWGQSTAVPFSFTKALPPTPSGGTLSAN